MCSSDLPPPPPPPLSASPPSPLTHRAQEHSLLPPSLQALDYCQWPIEAQPADRVRWRQQQHARVPQLPTVFAPPGFLIERVSVPLFRVTCDV